MSLYLSDTCAPHTGHRSPTAAVWLVHADFRARLRSRDQTRIEIELHDHRIDLRACSGGNIAQLLQASTSEASGCLDAICEVYRLLRCKPMNVCLQALDVALVVAQQRHQSTEVSPLYVPYASVGLPVTLNSVTALHTLQAYVCSDFH